TESESHYRWLSDFEVAERTEPPWALVVERLDAGRFYGQPKALLVDGEAVATEPRAVLDKYRELHGTVLSQGRRRLELEQYDRRAVGAKEEPAGREGPEAGGGVGPGAREAG